MATSKRKGTEPQSIQHEVIEAIKPLIVRIAKTNELVELVLEKIASLNEDVGRGQNSFEKGFSQMKEEIALLNLKSEVKESPTLEISEFARRAGLSHKTIRNYLTDGKISYNQAGKGYKISIPTSELQKLKQM
jgi:hypothetical protein